MRWKKWEEHTITCGSAQQKKEASRNLQDRKKPSRIIARARTLIMMNMTYLKMIAPERLLTDRAGRV